MTWHQAALTPAELATVQYIGYPCWTDFYGGTRPAADRTRRPRSPRFHKRRR